jgi:hypothetical protein
VFSAVAVYSAPHSVRPTCLTTHPKGSTTTRAARRAECTVFGALNAFGSGSWLVSVDTSKQSRVISHI